MSIGKKRARLVLAWLKWRWISCLHPVESLARVAFVVADSQLTASFVDAERAFPGGRLQVHHTQYNISSDTFRAEITLGSWYLAPWFSGFKDCGGILKERYATGRK